MSDLSSQSEVGFSALIAAAKAGDPEAREAAIKRIYPKVQAMVHKRLRTNIILKNPWLQPMFSTGDIVQEVFIGVLSTAPDLDGKDEKAVTAYLAAVVQNRLMDMIRVHFAARRDARRQVDAQELGVMAGAAQSPQHEAEIQERLAIYHEVVQSFTPQQRDLLRHRLEQGHPFEKLAMELELPSGDAARKRFDELYAKLLIRLGNRGVHAISRDTRDV